MPVQGDSQKPIMKAPSGKEIGHKSLINLQSMSKSVDKQPSGQVNQKGSGGTGSQQQQYLMLNNSKDFKGRESAKRRRDASGASNAGNSSTYANSTAANLKEKRLS